jgi:hypothetical protein
VTHAIGSVDRGPGRRRRLAPFAVLAGAALFAPPLSAQQVAGTIRDADDVPMPGATAELLSLERRVVASAISTAPGGDFRLVAPAPGLYFLRAWRIGADTATLGPVNLEAGSTFELDFLLEVRAVAIEGVEVSVEARIALLQRAGFYDRSRVSNGIFLTPELIEKASPHQTTDVLVGIPGLQLDQTRVPGWRTPMLRGSISGENLGGRDSCYPVIYVNGGLVQQGGSAARDRDMLASVLYDIDSIRPGALLGIEIYRSPAETPSQFSGGATVCGVIVLWTR